ncbi:MAG TPA: leucine--tRNA ligase [Candidatus Eremiobacteraceae bacterium]|nr:leucine--tRNA ligase [Candidatus Eremiobacteraceae bacterium]
MVSAEVPAYTPQTIEPKWQAIWQKRRQYETAERADKQKFYLVEMLPYPSGDLHVGHARNYTLGDVVGRFMRMRGYNVLRPMGWDAFGLPAEVAAIARGLHPRDWTNANIANMRAQLIKLGTSYDWSREINSSSPDYYRWTQWLFLLMYRKGLAYKAEATLNWCPQDQTVLANEQAEGGVCWRCGSAVERRTFKQWFFRITQYADQLLAGLDNLTQWPDRVKTMQRNWIGRSQGVTCSFDVVGMDARIDVFTTRIDTIFGATYLALAPEHPLVGPIIEKTAEGKAAREFIASLKNKSELDLQMMGKQGVFTGGYATNPLSGERIPIWVTNYVLAEYGSGAVMGVPAHDQRDFEFAQARGLPVRIVIVAPGKTGPGDVEPESAFTDDGVLVNSAEFSGKPSADVRAEMTKRLVTLGGGKPTVHYKLRDWLISRERYWGAPIPMVYCEKDGYVPVPAEQLPVLLPENVPLSSTQGSPLEHVPEFMNTTCPKCGGPARREAETMDTFMCSSWYYLRYLDPHDERAPWEVDGANYWAPVDHYIGGIEHAILHLMYARFFYKVVAEEKLVPGDEPFLRLFNQGMVLGENHEKMSKSRGNTIAIDDAVATYGADALRLFEMFAAPPEADVPWSTTGIAGATRTLQRIWRLVLTHAEALRKQARHRASNGTNVTAGEAALRHSVHAKIKQIGDEIGDRMHLNTSVALIMTLLNDLETFASTVEKPGESAVFADSLQTLLLLLAPFAPHITEELWERTGRSGSIHEQPWPDYDPRWLQRTLVTIVIQVNGKRRASIEAPPGLDKESAFAQARVVATVRAQLEGKSIRKLVYVQDRLLNIVVNEVANPG